VVETDLTTAEHETTMLTLWRTSLQLLLAERYFRGRHPELSDHMASVRQTLTTHPVVVQDWRRRKTGAAILEIARVESSWNAPRPNRAARRAAR